MLKAAFGLLSPLDPAQIDSLASRLRKVDFEFGEGLKVIGVDKSAARHGSGARLTVELVQRRAREGRRFDDTENKVVSETRFEDRVLIFSLDFSSAIAETPGSFRDLGIFCEALKRAGGGREIEQQRLLVSLLPWVQEVAKMYETAQLGQVVVDNLFIEPRLIGRYTAKSVDNRLDMAYLQEVAGQLRSLRLGFFHEGVRRSVEARADGVLVVSASDEEDAEHFFNEQRQIILSHSSAAEG